MSRMVAKPNARKPSDDRQDDGKPADKDEAKPGPWIRAPKRLADSTLGIVMKGYDDQNC
ncbi:hypothetical protein ACSFE6_10155 [Pseudomonas baetica]|uniref:hypothetical protein n=1 Tax=Pseudomonas baetica TaxID=674054 RepID=UPI003EEFC415